MIVVAIICVRIRAEIILQKEKLLYNFPHKFFIWLDSCRHVIHVRDTMFVEDGDG